jgi:hypothetical protein
MSDLREPGIFQGCIVAYSPHRVHYHSGIQLQPSQCGPILPSGPRLTGQVPAGQSLCGIVIRAWSGPELPAQFRPGHLIQGNYVTNPCIVLSVRTPISTWETSMKDITQLAEQNILEYKSRQKHIDTLLEQAHKSIGEGPEHAEARDQLAELKKHRDKLVDHLDDLKRRKPDEWLEEELEQSGPLMIWDEVAHQIEKLVERFEK